MKHHQVVVVYHQILYRGHVCKLSKIKKIDKENNSFFLFYTTCKKMSTSSLSSVPIVEYVTFENDTSSCTQCIWRHGENNVTEICNDNGRIAFSQEIFDRWEISKPEDQASLLEQQEQVFMCPMSQAKIAKWFILQRTNEPGIFIECCNQHGITICNLKYFTISIEQKPEVLTLTANATCPHPSLQHVDFCFTSKLTFYNAEDYRIYKSYFHELMV